MANIKVMSETLSNKIAAGEVIERIVSVVKELVENAIDAESDEIIVELKESGLREIKVTDNGVGMCQEDAKKAFLRHATSKLFDLDELFNITTLGFRGEALPSIAAVSLVEMRTCLKEDTSGTYLLIKGGKLLKEESSPLVKGTSIKITNLFYNTPARLKHLASSHIELANIIDYLNKISFAYPQIRFKLTNDHKTLKNTTGSGNLLKVITSIYGLDIAQKMIKITNENNDYSLTGYISLPEITRSNKNHMTTIINQRVIKNTLLYHTIDESYRDYKEEKRYPICILNITCDPSLLDVNIHPSKLDIKFSNSSELTNLIRTTIISALENKLLIPQIKFTNKTITPENLTLDISRTSNIVKEEEEKYLPSNGDLKSPIISDPPITNQPLPELYPVGLLLGTYIVCENEKGIYLIDQHAAKERINYEKVKEKLNHPSKETITSLIPLVVDFPYNEYLILKNNLNILKHLNIVTEEFGLSSLRVISHPTWFKEGQEEETFKNICEMIIKQEKNFSLERFNDRLAKMISCKMSIKGNTYIDKPSMESLIDDLRKCHNPYNCPHGRPSIIHFSKYELEKMFKRSI